MGSILDYDSHNAAGRVILDYDSHNAAGRVNYFLNVKKKLDVGNVFL
jgi:hypothetical protein